MRVYEVASLLRAAQHMWGSEDDIPTGFVSICLLDSDGTLKQPLCKLSGVAAQVVQYFEYSPLWRVAIVSNNPLGSRKLEEIIGRENVFTPQIPWFYKQSKRAVDDLSGWLEQVAHIKPIHEIYMVGDRERVNYFLGRVVTRTETPAVRATFLKLPEMEILKTSLAKLIP